MTGRCFSISWAYPMTYTILQCRTRSRGKLRCSKRRQHVLGIQTSSACSGSLALLPRSNLKQTRHDLALAEPEIHPGQLTDFEPLELQGLSQGLCPAFTESGISKGHGVLSRVIELAFEWLREVLDGCPEFQRRAVEADSFTQRRANVTVHCVSQMLVSQDPSPDETPPVTAVIGHAMDKAYPLGTIFG